MDEPLTYQEKAEEFADALFDGISTNHGKTSDSAYPRFMQYSDEPLNPNIKEAKVDGNILQLDFGGSKIQVSLPDATIQAHSNGDLPLNTLANAVYKQIESAYQKSMNINESDKSQENANSIHI